MLKRIIHFIKKLLNKSSIEKNSPPSCLITEENNLSQDNSKSQLTDNVFDNKKEKIPKEPIPFSNLKEVYMGYNDQADILIVKMLKRAIEENQISPEHQIRPFIKLNEDDNNVYGYYTTSNILKTTRYQNTPYKYIINNAEYKLHKNSLVKIEELVQLPWENIKYQIDTLTKKDLIQLLKISGLFRNHSIYSEGNSSFFNTGDIIEYNNQKYLIYKNDTNSIYGVHIEEANEIEGTTMNSNYFWHNNSLYQLNYYNCINLNKKDNLLLIDSLSMNTYIVIMNNLNRYLHKNQVKVKSRRNQPYH